MTMLNSGITLYISNELFFIDASGLCQCKQFFGIVGIQHPKPRTKEKIWAESIRVQSMPVMCHRLDTSIFPSYANKVIWAYHEGIAFRDREKFSDVTHGIPLFVQSQAVQYSRSTSVTLRTFVGLLNL